uniref:Uncharacterized protein n=1 Tax=Anopheles coluzzii TaxID=1518534 RepID=A0A8W7P2R8_ANOCL
MTSIELYLRIFQYWSLPLVDQSLPLAVIVERVVRDLRSCVTALAEVLRIVAMVFLAALLEISFHSFSPLPVGSNRSHRVRLISDELRQLTQYVHGISAIVCRIETPRAFPCVNALVSLPPSASCFFVPVPFLNVNVSVTCRSLSHTFSTVQTNTAHAKVLRSSTTTDDDGYV